MWKRESTAANTKCDIITFLLQICISGLAVVYNINATFTIIPIIMPNSNDIVRHESNVAKNGITSIPEIRRHWLKMEYSG